jgi:hypothetical protein
MAKKEKKKKSFIKRLLKWTGILFLLLIILAIVLPYFFKDEIVQFIEDEAEKHLNAELEIGEVNLSFISTFPDFVLEIQNLSLTGVGQFEGDTLFGTKKLEVALNLSSVLFGDSYEINRFHLSEPNINVLVTKEGIPNYDIYKADSTETADESSETEPAPFKMALSEYVIENGSLMYSDSSMAFDLILTELNHSGSGDFTLEELVLKTKTTASSVTVRYDGVNYIEGVIAEIECDIKMNLTTFMFEFQENIAKLNELEVGFDGWFQMADEFYDMDISFEAKDSKFKSLLSMIPGVYSPDFGEMKTDGTIGFSGKVYDKYSDNSMPGFEIGLNVENAYFQYPNLPEKVSDINIVTSIKRGPGPDLDNLVIDVQKAHLEFAENFIDAKMNLTKPMSDPNFRGEVKSHIDLAKMVAVIPMDEGDQYEGVIDSEIHFKGQMSSIMEERYEEFEASGSVGIQNVKYTTSMLLYDVNVSNAKMNFNPQQIVLESFDSKIGDSDISADGVINNYLKYAFYGDPLEGTFNITSTYINLDELMDFGEEESVAIPTSVEAEAIPYEVIPLPENVNFDLNATVNEIRYDSMSVRNVTGNINLANSVARLNDVKLELLGGKLSLTGLYDTKNPSKPNVALNLGIDHFDIGETAKYFNTIDQLVPIANKCTGFFSSKMKFNSQVDQYWMPVYSTIFGDGDLFTKKVYVEGFEPLNKLAKAVKIDRLSKQTIQDVQCFFKIIDGKIHVEPFDVKLGKIKSTVAGNTSFEQDINYVMNMSIPRSELGAGANNFIEGLAAQAADKGINVNLSDIIPVHVKIFGKVTDPKITTDIQEQGKDIMDDIKEQIIEEVTDQINDKIDEVDKALQAKIAKLMADAQEKTDQLRAQGKKTADQIRKEGKKAADKVRKEGGAKADQMEAEAKKQGGLAEKLAKKGIEKVRAETDVNAKKIEAEAENKAKKTEAEANKSADKIMDEAQAKADQMKIDQRVGD